MTICRHGGKIASVIPSILVDSLTGGFFILVVAHHHVDTSCDNLALYVLWIVRVNLYFHAGQRNTTWARLEVVVIAIGNERCTLGCAIANSDREIDAFEELLNLLVERSATYDNLIGFSSKGCIYLATDALFYLLWYDRHLQQYLDNVALNLWEHTFADNLLNNKRYGYNYIGLYFLESLGNDGRRRQTGEEVQVIAWAEGE